MSHSAESVTAHRLGSHLLSNPAANVITAARHMLAVQSQDLWGGRLALATRSAEQAASAVDNGFDNGTLVRSWTMRGTLHVVALSDLRWVLSLTRDRMLQQATKRRAELAITDETVSRARAIARDILADGSRVTREELFAAWDAAGVVTAKARGTYLLFDLATRCDIALGPTVAHPDGEPRQQFIIDVTDAPGHEPDDPRAEFAIRYLQSHGPASIRDFAWWSGLTIANAKTAFAAAGFIDIGTDQLITAPSSDPGEARSPIALGSFDEYYVGYADRSRVASPEAIAAVGPGINGLVKPVIVADGAVAATWKPPGIAQRRSGTPSHDLLLGSDLRGDEANRATTAALARLTS